MTIDSQIISHIHQLAEKCKHSLQRRMVVVSGSKEWCLAITKKVTSPKFLAISHNKTLSAMTIQAPEKLHLVLGKEYENILWDGFSGLSPDGLGIASGLLKGGGLFVLLLPPHSHLRSNADSDYARMCSETFGINDCHTFFLQRLVDHLKQSNEVFLFEEDTELSQKLPARELISSKPGITLPTSDQLIAIAAIKKVATGHRNRPLVMQANRGRGKSSALGIAAADLFLERQFKTVITAPSKKACDAAFTHYKSQIESTLTSQTEISAALAGFEFLPIDYIIDNHIDCHLLFIDEAAAIPASILNDLIGRFSRVVYSTTVHGYEGNGQGFAIRFMKTLDKHYSQWHSITLSQPIRWLENDMLEPWFFRFLLLDARLEDISQSHTDSLQTAWITQKELYEDEALFEQIFSLLVSAHYQTSPSDIRLILDHPQIKVVVAHAPVLKDGSPRSVYGVCLSIEEGGIASTTLANDIISGIRRPRGQLFPQALCASSANADFLIQSTYRVMRIAVHPSLQQTGIGSSLLSALRKNAQEHNIDSLSTSYGLSPELLCFWQKNQFQAVKLGTKLDGASGLRSIMMMHPLSSPAQQLLETYSQEFLKSFIFNLNRLHAALATDIVALIIQSSSASTSKQVIDTKKIQAFAMALRPFEETNLELFEWLIGAISSAEWHDLSEAKQELLISQILQNRDYKTCLKHSTLTGRKQLLIALRSAVEALFEPE